MCDMRRKCFCGTNLELVKKIAFYQVQMHKKFADFDVFSLRYLLGHKTKRERIKNLIYLVAQKGSKWKKQGEKNKAKGGP